MEFIPYAWLSGDEEGKEIEVKEKIGIERFGKNSMVSGMGSMLVIAMVLAGVICIMLIIKVITRYSTKIMRVYLKIKAKIQYNSILRYVL